jgi:RNA polymerase sigma-70 factor (ECF subfamily)
MERFDRTLEAARAGSENAWESLYRELSPPLLGYLRARGAVEPEDLLGEVFLQIVRDLPRFDGDERGFRAWAFAIAHHRLLDDHRRRGKRPVEPVPDEELLAHAALGDLEREALERVRSGEVRDALARLSPNQQSVLMLRLLGDLTVEEVALVLGKRPGAVKAIQRRGLATLRRALSTLMGVPL